MKKGRILSVVLVISMLCANLFSSILSVNASTPTLVEKVILEEDFENGVTASTDKIKDGGFVLDAKAGTDTGYNSSTAFCPGWAPGTLTAKDVLGVSTYFLPAYKIADSGQYLFKFEFYRGSNTKHNYIELRPDQTSDVEIAEMTYGANCTVKTWYSVETLVDLDEHTFSTTVFNTDDSVFYTRNGSYPYDVVSNIVFSVKASNSIGSGSNVTGFPSKIDNLYISRLYYDDYEEPDEIEIIAGEVINENFENQVSLNPNFSTEGGWNLSGTAGFDTGYQNSGQALCVGYAPVTLLERNIERSSEYYLPINYTSQTGLVYFKFDFYCGEKPFNNPIRLGSDEATEIQIADLIQNPQINRHEWYNVEVLVDLDENTYSLTVLNTDGTVFDTKSGPYNQETVRYISFGTMPTNSLGSGDNLTGYNTKIDNLEVYTHFNESIVDLQKNSDTFTGKAETFSCSWKSNTYLLFLVAYNSAGRVLDVETLRFESPIKEQDEIINKEIEIPFDDNATIYKTFLWYNDMTPCCLPAEFDSSK